MNAISLSAPGWKENIAYPGTHWLYHDQRGNYKANIDFGSWTNGFFVWRVMMRPNRPEKDIIGRERTLENAQTMVEDVLSGRTVQLNLF